MHPQAKECHSCQLFWESRKEARERFSLPVLRGNPPHRHLISDFRPPELERISLCHFKPRSLWYAVMAKWGYECTPLSETLFYIKYEFLIFSTHQWGSLPKPCRPRTRARHGSCPKLQEAVTLRSLWVLILGVGASSKDQARVALLLRVAAVLPEQTYLKSLSGALKLIVKCSFQPFEPRTKKIYWTSSQNTFTLLKVKAEG